jgi:hypothetical protein
MHFKHDGVFYLAIWVLDIWGQRKIHHAHSAILAYIRPLVSQELALCSVRFRRPIERLGGRRQILLKRSSKTVT